MAGGDGQAHVGAEKFAGGGGVDPFVGKALHALERVAAQCAPVVVDNQQRVVAAEGLLPGLPALGAVADAGGAVGAGGEYHGGDVVEIDAGRDKRAFFVHHGGHGFEAQVGQKRQQRQPARRFDNHFGAGHAALAQGALDDVEAAGKQHGLGVDAGALLQPLADMRH